MYATVGPDPPNSARGGDVARPPAILHGMPTVPHSRGDVLFVLDPLSTLSPKKDSSYVMIAEALRRGYTPWMVELSGLLLRGSDPVARAYPLGLRELGVPLHVAGDPQ